MSLPIPRAPSSRSNSALLDDVALDRVLQVVAPVQLDRAGDVSLVVEIRILVDLGDDDPGLAEVLGEPVGRDEHLLGVTPGHARETNGAGASGPTASSSRTETRALEPVPDLAVGTDDEDPRLGGQVPLLHPLVHALGGIVVLVDLDVDEADARVGVLAAHRTDDVDGRAAGAARAVLRRRERDDERRVVGQRVGDRAAIELPIGHLRRRQLVERRRGETSASSTRARRRRCRAPRSSP